MPPSRTSNMPRPSLPRACRSNALARAMRRVQLQGGARGPHARCTPCTFTRRGASPPFRNLPPAIVAPAKPALESGTLSRGRRELSGWISSQITPPSDEWSGSSAGFARATDPWGRLRRGPPRPPPMERRRWALIIALGDRYVLHGFSLSLLEGGDLVLDRPEELQIRLHVQRLVGDDRVSIRPRVDLLADGFQFLVRHPHPLDTIGGLQQDRIVPEGRVPLLQVEDRDGTSEELIPAGRRDGIDGDARPADPDGALGSPRPGRVVLRRHDGVPGVEREHERQARPESDARVPPLGGAEVLDDLLGALEPVVPRDVLDVVAVDDVGSVLARVLDVALDVRPRPPVLERHRQLDAPAREVQVVHGRDGVLELLEGVDQSPRRQAETVVLDEHAAEGRHGLYQAVERGLF